MGNRLVQQADQRHAARVPYSCVVLPVAKSTCLFLLRPAKQHVAEQQTRSSYVIHVQQHSIYKNTQMQD